MRRFLKILKYLFFSIASLILLLFILIQFAGVQRKIANVVKGSLFAENGLSEIQFDRIKIGLTGNVSLYKLSVPGDIRGQLISIEKLRVKISFASLLKKEIFIRSILLEGTTGQIYRYKNNTFNFSNLLSAKVDSSETISDNNFRFEVGNIELEDILFRYHDSLSQVFLDVDLGYFRTNMNGSDIANLELQFDNIVLKKTHIILGLNESLIPSPELNLDTNLLMPIINAGAIKLADVSFLFNVLSKNSYIETNVNKMSGKDILVDFGKELVNIKYLELKNSNYNMDYRADTLLPDKPDVIKVEVDKENNFAGGWAINVQEVKGKNNSVLMQLEEMSDSLLEFNSSNFGFENIDFSILDTEVQNELIKTNIKSVSFTNANNFQLLNAALDLTIDKNHEHLVVHKFKSQFSEFIAEVETEIPLSEINLENLTVHKLMFKGELSPKEFSYFAPYLKSDVALLLGPKVKVNIGVNGNEKDVTIEKFSVISDNYFLLKAKGVINNYKNPDKLKYSLTIDSLLTQSAIDILPFQSENIKNNLPAIFCKLKVDGETNRLSAKFSLNDKTGHLKGKILSNKEGDSIITESFLRLDNFNFSNYLKDSLLGKASGDLHAIVYSYNEIDSILSVSANGNIDTLELASALINNLQFDGSFADNSFKVKAEHRSDDLSFNAEVSSLIYTDSLDLKYSVQIDGFNAKSFNLTKDELILTALVAGDLKYSSTEELNLSSSIENLKLNYLGVDYLMDDSRIQYRKTKGQETTQIETQGLELWTKGNRPIQVAKNEIISFLTKNLKQEADSIPEEGVEFDMHCRINSPLAVQRLLEGVFLDTLVVDSLVLDYSLQNKVFKLETSIPYIGYSGVILHDLSSKLFFKSDSFSTNIVFNQIDLKEIKANKFEFSSHSKSDDIYSALRIYDEKDLLVGNIPVFMTKSDSIVRLYLSPNDIIISYKNWTASDKIALQYDYKNNEWSSEGVELFYQDQSIRFYETPNEVAIQVENLNLANTSHFISVSDTNFITHGLLSGRLWLENTREDLWYIRSEFTIKDIQLFSRAYGNIDFSVNQFLDKAFKADVNFINKADFLHYTGQFGESSTKEHSGSFYISDLSKYTSIIDTNIIQFHTGQLQGNAEAKIREHIPQINGDVILSEAEVNIPQLGSKFKFQDEKISFSEKGIYLDKVRIQDLAGNILTADGDIFTTDFINYSFGLNIDSEYFQAFNLTAEQSDDFYGRLVLSTHITLNGTARKPDIKANVKIHENTNITVVLPGDDPLQTGAEDVVRFAKVQDASSDSLYIANSISNVSDSIESIIRQGKLNLVLTFSPLARYKIITNPISGDYAYFGLNGALVYRTVQNGLTELTGNIQIVDGLYEMSFYEMIKKQFIIEPQSTIYFSGPISNTTLDLRAKNIVRTNSLALMSSESIGTSAEEKALYNQRLPYELYFNVGGLLLSPEVSFALDLPDEYKQNSPMIAAKLNKLSSPEMEQERNMQVFALLVTGGFIAENIGVTSGSSSSDLAAAAARNSVNSILSQQLNRLTSDNIKYFDMNLGFNTYEDYARRGGSTTTDLDVQISKSLFDDKVNFEMESRINLDGSSTTSQSSSNHNTDYKIYYNLSEEGTYKAKAYNLSIYDLFDGDITNTGLGIVFSKDFDGRKKRNFVEIDSVQVND